jgi:hypothetical protein
MGEPKVCEQGPKVAQRESGLAHEAGGRRDETKCKFRLLFWLMGIDGRRIGQAIWKADR